jgi:hypothetical protein
VITAQSAPSLARVSETVDLPFAYDGPPVPMYPDVITRDAAGRATIRAVRLSAPLRLDGRLDDEIYTMVQPVNGMIQTEPNAGQPSTQDTDVWVMFDADNVYVSVRCWEAHLDRMILNEMRRDNVALYRNDHIDISIDTFYDRRNAIFVSTTPIGGRVDAQITNERQFQTDWNPVYQVETGRFEGGWTAEFAIPFKSIRYRPGRAQIWGFNVQRENLWKNEVSTLIAAPPALGTRGVMQMSIAPTLVGIEAPPGSKNLDIKPYAVSSVTTDRTVTPRIAHDPDADFGFDLKYGITQNLTADLTYNTDFAQVEADEQQVNLTRFSLFFPEKRDFFLENQGTFGFGGATLSGSGANASDTPVLFYSRRIGLDQNRAIPIVGGGRATGRVGRFTVGALDIQADDESVTRTPTTNFSVLRLKRDVLRRSSIGMIYTGRSVAQNGLGRNDAFGVDGTFAFFNNLTFNTFWARTRTDGVPGEDDTSHRAQMDYAGDRYGVQIERLAVGRGFNPEIGFVRRPDMRRHFGLARFSPRPRASKIVRKYFFTSSLAHIENGAGRLESRDWVGEFAGDLHNSDHFSFVYRQTYEFLPAPFDIATGVTVPVGGYDFSTASAGYSFGAQRPVSGNVSVEGGTFYNGRRTTLAVRSGRFNLGPRFSFEPTTSVNWVDLDQGAFTTAIVGSRVTYTPTPRMFVSALVQSNTGAHAVSANVRVRWEYQPGSELFIVFNEQRDTLAPRFPELANRAFIVKINRLLRY